MPFQASSAWKWENFYPPSLPGSDFYHQPKDENNHPHLDEDNEEKDEGTEREEVHCSEWGDHYSTLSFDSKSDNEEDERDQEEGSEIGTRLNFGSSFHTKTMAKPNYTPMKKFEKSDDVGSPVSWNAGGGGGEISDMKMVLRHRDLVEIMASIKEYFDKAADAGNSVSELQEKVSSIEVNVKEKKKNKKHF